MEKTYALPETLVRAIGNYLAERPYREVVDLLSAMQAAVTAKSQSDLRDAPAPDAPAAEQKDAP